MDRYEVEKLFDELDREGRRLKRWADTLEYQAGMDYGVGADHPRREEFLDGVASVARAGEALEEAARIIQRLVSS